MLNYEWSEILTYSKNIVEQKPPKYLKVLSCVCFGVALVLIVLAYIFTIPAVQKNLSEINDWFVYIGNSIAAYQWMNALAIIAFMFILKSVVPFIPFSIMFISAGLVFPTPLAILISTAGVALLCAIKFLWGRRYGGGGVHKLAFRSRKVTKFMGFREKGNKWMLGCMCFIPVFPIGAVSRAYGATRMRFTTFIQLALLGIMPRIVLWSFVGVNFVEPFTIGFLVPFIILLVISGISLLILDVLLQGERIKEYEKKSDNQS